jgi:hypothetical protein
MAKQRLTDRQRISGVTLTDLLHFVVTGDTSQSPAGSSYKGEVEQLFDAFSSYTCTNPLIVDTVNACNSGITINGNVTINGSATTINTEVIQSKDNNIILNYSGTHATALYGGITVEDGQSEGVDSLLFIDEDGCWHADPGFCDLTVDGVAFTAQTPYLFVDDGSINSITTRYTGNTVTDSDYSNIGGGKDNTIESNISGGGYSNIAGGLNNLIDDYRYSVIGGGNSNQILGGECYCNSNVIVGGEGNTIDVSYFSNIAGGSGNTIDSSYYSSVGGGRNNTINNSNYSAVFGISNNVSDYYSHFVAGAGNNVSGSFGTSTFGGSNTSTQSNYSTIIGRSNTLTYYSSYSSIINGTNNSMNYSYNSVVGGKSNTINNSRESVIIGGYSNLIQTTNTSFNSNLIGVGRNNRITGSTEYSSIVGGRNNSLYNNTYSTIVGGFNNQISQVGNGFNFIGGGQSNQIVGNTSSGGNVIVGGGNIGYSTSNIIDYGSCNFIGSGAYRNNNIISGSSYNSAIVAGEGNIIDSNESGFIGSGERNQVRGLRSSVVNGSDNIVNTNNSSILGGQSNTVNHNDSHIIGSNITSISANTTHVERLNIGTVNTGSTSTEVFVRETNGMVNTTPFSTVSGGLNGKYVELITGYTANVTQTITHNLGTGDEVVVDVIDTTNNERIGSVIDNYQTNALDLTLSQNYASIKIVIIG